LNERVKVSAKVFDVGSIGRGRGGHTRCAG
jgi:hypothetical protein